jgi:hypothetical protein
MKKIILLTILFVSQVSMQVKSDPRAMGMGGAYLTVAEGFRSVGINPANLAYSPPFTMNIVGAGFGINNSLLSLENYNELNGADLENPLAENYYPKEDVVALTEGKGIHLNATGHLPIPLINYSKDLIAFTSDFIVFADMRIPQSLVELAFLGNELGKTYSFNIQEDILAVNEYALSFAVPYNNFALGFSLKYLQGLSYFGIDQDSSYATFITDTLSFNGSGRYLMRQGIGGSGMALDLGFTTEESPNGWRFGISFINILGSIKWNNPSFIQNVFGDDISALLPVRQNEYYVYEYEINNVNGISLVNEDTDSLFVSDSYAVVETEDGLIRSDEFSDSYINSMDLKEFSIDYPTYFRMGLSKNFNNKLLIVSDLSTGFGQSNFSYNSWKMSIGAEITRYKHFPIRIGYAFGGNHENPISFGFGLHLGAIKFDLGMSLNKGIMLHSAKGLNISTGFIWVLQ